MAKTESESATDTEKPVSVVLYLLMWVGSALLVGVDIMLVRAAVLRAAAWYYANKITTTAQRINFNFSISFLDKALLIVMVVAGLGGIVALEYLYRGFAERHELARKGWKPVAILVGIGLVCLVLLSVL